MEPWESDPVAEASPWESDPVISAPVAKITPVVDTPVSRTQRAMQATHNFLFGTDTSGMSPEQLDNISFGITPAGYQRGILPAAGEMANKAWEAAKRLPGEVADITASQYKTANAGADEFLLAGERRKAEDELEATKQGNFLYNKLLPSSVKEAAVKRAEGKLTDIELGELSAKHHYRMAQNQGNAAIPDSAGYLENQLAQGLGSVAATGPMVVAGAMTGAVVPALVALSGQAAAQRYGQLREAGVPEPDATVSSALLGSLEGLTEAIPTGKLAKQTPIVKKAVEFLITDVLGENISSLAQLADDYKNQLRDDVTINDIQKTISDTTVQTAIGAGTQVGAFHLLQTVIDKANARAEKRQFTTDLEKTNLDQNMMFKPPTLQIEGPKEQADFEVGPEGVARRSGEYLPENTALPAPAYSSEPAPQEDLAPPPRQMGVGDEVGPQGFQVPEGGLPKEYSAQQADEIAKARQEYADLGIDNVTRVPAENNDWEPVSQSEKPPLKGAAAKRAVRTQKVETLRDAITEIVQPHEVTVKKGDEGWSIYVRQKPIVTFTTEGLAKQVLGEVRQEITGQHGSQPTVLGEKIEMPAEPTPDQATAGNYRKPDLNWKGLDIKVENTKGMTRSGLDDTGQPFARVMQSDYGYFKGTKSTDGEGVDVFMGPHRGVKTAYVVDQLKPDGLSHDEPKVVIGVRSEEDAKKLYLKHYPKEWKGLGAITPMPVDGLKAWLASDHTTKPLSWEAPRQKTALAPRPTQVPQAKHDSVLEYLSKLQLHGAANRGLSVDELAKEGLDPAEMKSAAGHGINRPFTKGGGSLDHAAEVLTEAGYPIGGDKNKLLDVITKELHQGKKTYAGDKQMELPEEDLSPEGHSRYELSAEEAALEAKLERLAVQHEHHTDDDAPLFQRPKNVDQDAALKERTANTKVVDKDGSPLRVFHGTGRGDRFVKGIKQGRATSGPMPYFTESPQVASNYATGKQDTSMLGNEMHYREWFRYTPKGGRSDQALPSLWHELSGEQKAKFNDALTRLQMSDESGKIEDHGENGGISPSTYAYELSQNRGNGISAAIELWLNSGALFNQEHHFMSVLKQAGIDTKRIDFVPQHSDAFPTVIPTYLAIKNPLDTSRLPSDLISKLEQAVKGSKSSRKLGSDAWDKNTRFTPKEWVYQLKIEIDAGDTQHVWTSIPDLITKAITEMGYDGIKDVGGKNGGAEHTVWIPFRRDQVISATGRKDVQFKRAASAATPLTKPDIQAEVDRFLGKLKTKPDVEIVPTYKELPQHLKDATSEDWSASNVSAVYWRGKVYIVQDKQTSLESVRESVIHETAHYAVATLFNQAQRHALLDELVKVNRMETVRRGVQEFGKTIRDADGNVTGGFDPGNPMHRRVAANEAMAYYAQKYLNDESIPVRLKRVVERWVAAIRDALRQFFGKGQKFDNLYLKKVIQDMMSRLKAGPESDSIGTEEVSPAASRKADQTRSKEFKEWFGASKIVGENGRPLVVYHGTDSEFTEFRKDAIDNPDEGGFWFHENANYTADYGDNNMAVYLKMEKPYHFSWADWSEGNGPSVAQLKSKGYDGYIVHDFVSGNESDTSHEDGERAFLVFEPMQIKSATGNSGAFDSRDTDIMAQNKAPTFYSALTRAIEEGKLNKAPAAQWSSTIANLKGVKAEEIEWSGLTEWLAKQTGPVTKEQVVEYLRANEIEVRDVMKGSQSEDLAQQEHDRLVVELTALGYTPDSMDDTGLHAMDSNDGNERWVKSESGEWLNPEDEKARLPDMVEALATDLAVLRDEMADGLDSTVRENDETRYGQYTLPGGNRYRELLLTLPDNSLGVSRLKDFEREMTEKYGDEWLKKANSKEHSRWHRLRSAHDTKSGYKSSHWEETNILAHVRFDERTDVDGKHVLHIAEVQSDWHQQGRKRGYGSNEPTKEEIEAKIKELKSEGYTVEDDVINPALPSADPSNRGPAIYRSGNFIQQRAISGSEQHAWEKFAKSQLEFRNKVPDAPFKTTWPELAMKRMIRFAAENGFDRLTWDTGETSAARYDLSKQLDSVQVRKSGDGGPYSIIGRLDNRNVFVKHRLEPNELDDLVGKDLAEKARAQETESHIYTDIDLKFGGEGMIGFYDKILPATVGKYVKKWGGKVSNTSLVSGDTKEQRTDWRKESDPQQVSVHVLDINPVMRAAAMEGQPLFHRADILNREVPKDSTEAKGYAKLANGIIDTWNKKIGNKYGALGNLPEAKDYLIERYKTLGHMKEVKDITRGIFDSLMQADKKDSAEVYTYLTSAGAKPDAIVNEKIRATAVNVKEMIDQQGRNLVDAGLLPEEAYETYRDQYLPRLYLRHILDDGKSSKAQGTGKKMSDLGYLKKRKDIPEEVRKVIFGEITDPAFLSAFGLSRTMRDLAIHNFLDTISQNKAWTPQVMMIDFDGKRVTPFWLQAEAKQLRKQADHIKNVTISNKARRVADRMDTLANAALHELAAQSLEDFAQVPDSPRYGALRGAYVRKEIHEDLVGSYNWIDTSNLGGLDKFFADTFGQGGRVTKVNQLWKMSKVTLNIPSHFRNMYGNTMMLHMSGVNGAMLPTRLYQAINSLVTKDHAYQIGMKYGLSEATFANNELARIRDEWLLLQKSKQPTANVAFTMIKQVGQAVGDIYQFEEMLFKLAKLHDGLAKGVNEADAMIDAHKWLFDYSLVPQWVRYVRNAPFGIPFLSYQYFVFPRLLETAIRRPIKYLPYLLAIYAIGEALMAHYGADDDDLKKLKKSYPDWMNDKGSLMLWPYQDEQGRWQVLDTGSITPWGNYADTASELVSGNIGGAARSVGLLGGPAADVISAFKTGVDPFTKRPIVNPGDPAWEQTYSVLNYARSLALPSFMTENGAIQKVIDAKRGKVDPKSGEPLLNESQATLRLFGINVYPVDPEATREKNIHFMAFQIQETRRRMGEKLKDKNLTETDREEIRRVYIEEINRRQNALQQYQFESEIPPTLQRGKGDLTSRIAPLIDGKNKTDTVQVLRDSGHPALAALISDMPAKPRPLVAKALQSGVPS